MDPGTESFPSHCFLFPSLPKGVMCAQLELSLLGCFRAQSFTVFTPTNSRGRGSAVHLNVRIHRNHNKTDKYDQVPRARDYAALVGSHLSSTILSSTIQRA